MSRKKLEEPKERITILVPVDLQKTLMRLAEHHERSFNGEVVWALRQYLEHSIPQKGEHSNDTGTC